jgi:hypothetical protein
MKGGEQPAQALVVAREHGVERAAVAAGQGVVELRECDRVALIDGGGGGIVECDELVVRPEPSLQGLS